MSEDRSLELPERVVFKIQKDLGICPASLPQHNLVSLFEELCDTALNFDREEHGIKKTAEEKPISETAAAISTQKPDPLVTQ